MRNEWWIMHWFIGSSWAQRTWFYLSYKFLWVGSLLGYDFKQSFSWYLELMLNTLKPKKEIARTTNVHWLTVAWAPLGCVGPHGGAGGSVRLTARNAAASTCQRRCDGHTQTEAGSERVGGRRRKSMNANRSHTRLHTHWRCPSVFPLDMFRGASRGGNTYKRRTKPGQLRKCWPNFFFFLHDVQHVIWSHMHSYKFLPYHCGTNTLTTVIPGSGYTSRSASSAREHERLTTFWGVLFWKENYVKKK